jgi:phosphatidylglycerophosphate synthase
MYVQLAALTLALVALGVFAARATSSSRGINARIAKHDSSPFLGRFLVEYAYWLLSPVAQLAALLKLSPNVSSWACLMLGMSSGIAAGLGAVPLAGGLIIISALFDMLDGMLARSQGRASEAGEVLDAAVDRYAEFFFLTGLCFYYRHEPWAMVLVQAALLGSMLVSYSQAKAEAMRVHIPRGWMRRPERATYLGSGAFLSPLVTAWFEAGDPMPLHYPLLFATLLVAVFANATAIRRFIVLYAMAKVRR